MQVCFFVCITAGFRRSGQYNLTLVQLKQSPDNAGTVTKVVRNGALAPSRADAVKDEL